MCSVHVCSAFQLPAKAVIKQHHHYCYQIITTFVMKMMASFQKTTRTCKVMGIAHIVGQAPTCVNVVNEMKWVWIKKWSKTNQESWQKVDNLHWIELIVFVLNRVIFGNIFRKLMSSTLYIFIPLMNLQLYSRMIKWRGVGKKWSALKSRIMSSRF